MNGIFGFNESWVPPLKNYFLPLAVYAPNVV